MENLDEFQFGADTVVNLEWPANNLSHISVWTTPKNRSDFWKILEDCNMIDHPISDAFGSVFQRISASGTQRKWTVQLQGLYVPDGPREVYYAVWAKP